jgi:hypothetical protein
MDGIQFSRKISEEVMNLDDAILGVSVMISTVLVYPEMLDEDNRTIVTADRATADMVCRSLHMLEFLSTRRL